MTAESIAQDTFSRLYSEHHSWLLNWLHQRVRCRFQAEDHAHDTFLRLAVNKDANNLREPRAYLVTIAKGILVNHWRRAAVEQAYWEAIANLPNASAPSPEEHYLILSVLQEIDALLDELPEKVRTAFLLSQLDGLTYAEIGRHLNVSERMVKKYMARAMLHCLIAAQ